MSFQIGLLIWSYTNNKRRVFESGWLIQISFFRLFAAVECDLKMFLCWWRVFLMLLRKWDTVGMFYHLLFTIIFVIICFSVYVKLSQKFLKRMVKRAKMPAFSNFVSVSAYLTIWIWRFFVIVIVFAILFVMESVSVIVIAIVFVVFVVISNRDRVNENWSRDVRFSR